MQERYINPYTDFGFKKLFGTEMNKELLISFLNALLHEHEEIRDITFRNVEHMGDTHVDRKAVFDVYCENTRGERFIVEMQKAEQNYFKDRSIFYATFPIRDQAPQGPWDFNLKAVYTIGILDFVFPDHEYDDECFHHEVKLVDVKDKHVFYDKLTFVYVEMPKFNKTEEQLETMFDKWLFVLRNLSRLMDRPAALQERVFTRLFEQAEIARFTPDERHDYEESVKVYRDLINVVDTAEKKGYSQGLAEGEAKGHAAGLAEGEAKGHAAGLAEGEAKGREEGRMEERMNMARTLLRMGLPVGDICKATGLGEDVVRRMDRPV